MSGSILYDFLSKSNKPQKDFTSIINSITMKKKFPISVSLELTPLCNFNCKVCYIKMSEMELKASGYNIMNFEEWRYYIEGFVRLGTCYFTISGGECTLHPDFIKIYEYVYDMGSEITIMTNGSNFTESIKELFLKKPPSRICITLYGDSEESYENFSGNGIAFYKVRENIDWIVENHIPISLTTTIGKDNLYSLKGIFRYAKQKNIGIICESMLINYNKCDSEKINKTSTNYSEFISEYSSMCDDVFNFTENVTEEHMNIRFAEIIDPPIKKGIICNAGRNACAVNWKGEIKPCVSIDAFSVDPRALKGGIEECWLKITQWAENVPRIIECQQCKFRNYCKFCPAYHYGDTGVFGKVSPRLCFKRLHPERVAMMESEYDRRQAEKAKSAEKNNKTETTPDQGVVS